MIVVGDVVGEGRHLGLRPSEARELEIPSRGECRNGFGNLRGRAPCPVDQRAVVLDGPFQGFPGEVEAVERGIAALQAGQDAERLFVVIEAAIRRHGGVQSRLPAVPEGRMAEVVGERDGLGQVLV